MQNLQVAVSVVRHPHKPPSAVLVRIEVTELLAKTRQLRRQAAFWHGAQRPVARAQHGHLQLAPRP